MDHFKPPNALNLDGNLKENWKRWRQRFELYLKASGAVSKEEEIQVAILLHCVGEEALEVFNTFVFANDEDSKKLDPVLQAFENYCSPRKNALFDRFLFWKRVQKEGESVEQFVTDLKKMVKNCEYIEPADSMVRDCLVFGIRNLKMQERMLREDIDKLTLSKALDYCRAVEATDYQLQIMHGQNSTQTVHAVSVKPKFKPKKKLSSHVSNPSKKFNCRNCGTVHGINACPAYGKSCHNCHKLNHFSKYCRSDRKVHSVQENYNSRPTTGVMDKHNNQGEGSSIYMGALTMHAVGDTQKGWYTNVHMCGEAVQFKLDTGAEANAMPQSTYDKLRAERPTIQPTDIMLSSYGDHKVRPVGRVTIKCNIEEKYGNLDFYVVNNGCPILGLPTITKLGLVKQVHSLKDPKMDIMNKYSDLFDGSSLGCIGEYHIELRPDAIPVVHAPRKVPLSLQERLKQTLDKLEAESVIIKVDEATDWVNSLVIVEKADSSLRLCLDPRDLNRSIKREHYRIPTAEDISAKLNGKSVFSVLDMKDGFYQMKLDDASSKICTFNTPFGRYRFLRCPFGISSAPEVFQKKTDALFGDIDGVHVMFDDIIIAGNDAREHDQVLQEVLERARVHRVKFNGKKFKFRVSEVKYLGNIISANGLKADPSKIQAITEYPQPSDKSDLSRFFGMVNYLGQFIPNLSTMSSPLRNLLRKDVQWQWSQSQNDAFQKIKSALAQSPVLQFINVHKPVTIQCDASSCGIGACLMQDGHPIAFASRSLTAAEQNYATIEKELLSIVYACEKFNHFVYGKTVEIHSDHKPLEMITQKSLSKASPRLQRMLLRLQKYSVIVKWKPGREMHIADALSRAYLTHDDTDEELSHDMEVMVHSLMKNLPVSSSKLQELQQNTIQDPSLIELLRLVKHGWPHSRSCVPSCVKTYWGFRDEIYEAGGILFMGDRIIIPKEMQKYTLDLIHGSHLGMEKCKNRARELVYWPGINRDIEMTVMSCAKCGEFRNNNRKEPLIPHTVPNRPWQKIGADIFEMAGKDYLCVVDYFSKYPEICLLSGKTAGSVVNQLKSVFARQGIPEELCADNMPFASYEFRNFASEYGFIVTTSSPHFPQSNGFVERMIGTMKKLLKKADDPYIALLEYRNTPITGLRYSPSQILNCRRLRTKLPVSSHLLQPTIIADVRYQLVKLQERQKSYYDRTAKSLSQLLPGESVRYKSTPSSTWKPAVVDRRHSTPRSYVIHTDYGTQLRRNRRHLQKTSEPPHVLDSEEEIPEPKLEPIPSPQVPTVPSPITTAQRLVDNSIRTRCGRVVKPRNIMDL